jgi:hypothetical protein
MKITILLLAFCLSLSYAELVNLNPDPDGEPWWAGGVSEPSPEQMEKIKALPVITLSEKYKDRKDPLPSSTDNSALQFFRPVFNQAGGSCGQASGVGYNFTYEMNLVRNTSANTADNQFPTHHTWNFLNNGNGSGSWYFDGWDIIKDNGCPNVTTYGGMWPSSSRDIKWLDGYSLWKAGMGNRVTEQFTIPVKTPEGLETLKQYMNDHCDGSIYGGIVNFAAGSSGMQTASLASGTPHAGEYVVKLWTDPLDHAMTFAGYDDSVRVDYNGDGRYTNHLDITGDGIVDMRDWEIGALFMVNSWGTSWGTGGKAWVPYRTLALDISEGGIWNNSVHTMRVRETFSPSLTAKATVSYNKRDRIKIYAGVSADTSATVPEHTLSYPFFLYQGGSYGMRGDVNTLELGLDLSPLLSFVNSNEPAKYFLCIDETDPDNSGSGQIVSFSVIDSALNETVSSQSNLAVLNNSITYISLILSTQFNAPEITTAFLPYAVQNEPYSQTLTATGGSSPYSWDINVQYSETANGYSFPILADTLLSVTNDDDGYGMIALDFDFPFYGKLYTSITISTDGSILFNGEFENVRTEAAITKSRTISPYAADLMAYPEYGEGIFYYKNAELTEIRWITSMWGQPEVDLDFAVRLYPDGAIEFFYGSNLTTGITWASGISDANSNTSLISSFSNAFDPSGLKNAFTTNDYPHGMTLSPEGVLTGTLGADPQTWNIAFRVTDDNNISSVLELPFTLVSQLQSPANVVITAGATSNTLTWDTAPGVNMYKIYRSTDPYGTYTIIGSPSTASFEDTDISASSKYFYYVTADNSK